MNAIPRKTLGWLALIVLTVLPFAFRAQLPAWVFMWVLAFSMFFGCKLLTWGEVAAGYCAANRTKTYSYLFLWPGMDPQPFLKTNHALASPTMKLWGWAMAKTIFGAALIWKVVPIIAEEHWIARAIVGMLGVIFLLHFGLFHLLALAWQTKKIPVRPLMENPLAATSLAEFWGKRWNSGFHDLVFHYLFKPVAKKYGTRIAMLFVFVASGLIHELVITVPARGGYGLPTLYFLLQALAMDIERSKLGRHLGLGNGFKGWCFMALLTAGPVALLYPPPFLQNIINPMLKAIT